MSYRIKLTSPPKTNDKGKEIGNETYYLKCGPTLSYFDTEDSALTRQVEILDFLEDPNPLRKSFLAELRGTTVEIEKFEK